MFNWNVEDYLYRIWNKIATFIKINKDDKILDIGCGKGDFTVLFSKYSNFVYGIDIVYHQNWDYLSKRNFINFIVCDAHTLPFKDNSFDIVFVKDVLHHVSNPKVVLKEIKRVTKNNGKIIIMEVNRYSPISYIHLVLLGKHNHFTRNYFKKLILEEFNSPKFIYFDAHVYPIRNKLFLKFIHFLADFLEKIPILNNLCAYNVALVDLNEE